MRGRRAGAMKSAGGESAIERIGSAASHRARPSARLETACERWAVRQATARKARAPQRSPAESVTDAEDAPLVVEADASDRTSVPLSVPTQRAPDHSSMRPARPAPTTRSAAHMQRQGTAGVRIVRRCTVPRHTSTVRPRVAATVPFALAATASVGSPVCPRSMWRCGCTSRTAPSS